MHWGFALRAPPDSAEAGATPARLLLGVLPALAGWAALLLPLVPGLLLLACGLLVVLAVERAATARGLVGAAYLRLRLWLSLTASACLLVGAVLG